MGRFLVFTLLPLFVGASTARGAEKTFSVQVEGGEHARKNVPVCVQVILPASFADTSTVVASVQDAQGKRLSAQLTAPPLVGGNKLTADVPDGSVVRELCFVLSELPAGKSATFEAHVATKASDASEGDESARFSWHNSPGDTDTLELGSRPVLRYMYRAIDTSSPEAREQTYKVYHHVFDPEGGSRIVTKGPGGLYTHHRGLFYGFNRVTYGDGKQADVWHAKGAAHQSHEGFEASEAGPVLGRQRMAIDWHGEKGEVFAREERELTAYNVSGGTLIDFASRLTPVIEPVRLDGDPQHAGFHFRADNEVADRTKSQTWYLRPDGPGQPGETRNWPDRRDHVNLPWNAMSFVLGDQRYTACLLDRPDNPKEARFSERDYGRFGSYFEYDLTSEHPLEVRYRVWLQRGEMTGEQVAALAADFVDPPSATVP